MSKLSVNIFRPFASNRVRARHRKSMIPTSKTVAEFFAGIGLVRAALEAEGWNIIFANDIDPRKHSTYRRNFGDEHFVLGDIRALKTEKVPATFLATASFPCTDLSLAGARQGLNGSESGTLWNFLRIIDDLKIRAPKVLLLENVAGFLSSHSGKDFESTIERLNALGYSCDVVLLNATHFTPQSRQRLFVVAVCNDIAMPYEFVTDPTELPMHSARPEQLLHALKKYPNLNWRFRKHLTDLSFAPRKLDDVMEVLPSISDLWWNGKRTAHLLSQLSHRHKTIIRKMKEDEKQTWITVYKRMRGDRIRAEVRCDGIAGCLRTPRGGTSKQIAIRLGNGQLRVRHMTPREYGRLQGADDSFIIDENVNTALFGFGDAVCVPAVRWITRHLINPFVENMAEDHIEQPLTASALI
jgi:DNA (cytosine-5)-methyltransferase 1